MKIIGLDIGGANTKCVLLENDSTCYKSVYFPLWKKENCSKLEDLLKSFGKADVVCTVMTAEICDTFPSIEYGVKFVEKTVKSAFPTSLHLFFNCKGELRNSAEPARDFAAANWVASATYLMKSMDDFLLVDMGSTTTDLIPVKGEIKAVSSDLERLRRGELLYVGVVRTPLFYVLRYSKTVKAKLVPEYYALIGDALLITNDLSLEKYVCETPDGRGKSYEECCQRIAREFCCDREEIDCKAVAEEAKEELIKIVGSAIEWQVVKWNINTVVACGIGDFIVRSAAKRVGVDCFLIRDEIGDLSDVFPAHSCAMLAKALMDGYERNRSCKSWR